MTPTEVELSGKGAGLDARTQALVGLAAHLAIAGDEGEEALRRALHAAAEVAQPVEIQEVLLQSHLFVGFPTVLNAFIVWVDEIRGSDGSLLADDVDRRPAGEELCRAVYGRAYEQLRQNVRTLSVDLDRWMVEDGYGKTLSRPGLSPEVRELCVVSQLAAGGHDRQLRAHLFGALNVGASETAVEAALKVGLAVGAGTGSATSADRRLDMWAGVREKAGTRTSRR